VSKAAAAARARAGRWWRAQIRPEALSGAFQDLFGLELEELQLLTFGPTEVDGLSLGADVQLVGEDVNVRLSLSPELVSRVVGSAASRPKRVDLGGALAEPLRGAMHAIVAELCRRAARGAPLIPTRKQPTGAPWRADFSFRLGGASYRGVALLSLAEGSFGASAKIDPDASTPLSLPLVVATAVTTPSQIETLGRGDAFMFGSEPLAGLLGTTATLCAKNSQRGFSVSIDERGLVLQGARTLSYELEEPMSGLDEENTTREHVDARHKAGHNESTIEERWYEEAAHALLPPPQGGGKARAGRPC
jgi:hypothetical protein